MESIRERMENPIYGGRGGSRDIGKNMDSILNKSFIDMLAFGEEEEDEEEEGGGGENREKEEEERDKKEVFSRKHLCKRRNRDL